MTDPIFSSSLRNTLLDSCLQSLFGEFSETIQSSIISKIQIKHLKPGSILFKEGDPGDGMYFVLNGRLNVIMIQEDKEKSIIQLTKGDSVGEMALITGDPRTATIIAVRDTVLAHLKKEDFEIITKETPEILHAIAANIIRRLATEQKRKKKNKLPGIITLIEASSNGKITGIVNELVNYLQPKLKLLVINSDIIKRIQDVYTNTLNESIEEDVFFQNWLEEQENNYDLIVSIADLTNTSWLDQCISFSDTFYYVVDASIKEYPQLDDTYSVTNKKQGIVFVHANDNKFPNSVASGNNNESLDICIHVRENHLKDYQRLARIISGKAIGLVLSGGGAKGFAHIGVYAALLESGIPVDFIGGTSIGALIGAFIAMDLPVQSIKEFVRNGAVSNPMGDYTVFPYHSVIKGKRLEAMIKSVLKHVDAEEICIEDLWLNYFSISCNYTDSKAMIHTKGKLYTALRAGISIPGIFPPVIDHEKLLMDGGSFNNFPTDIMNNYMGVTNIIGVDIERDKLQVQNMDSPPSNSALLWDLLNPFQKKKYHFPSLLHLLLNATLFYSDYRKKELELYADLLFKPDVKKYTMLDWNAFDEIYTEGYNHAKGIIDTMSPELKSLFCVGD